MSDQIVFGKAEAKVILERDKLLDEMAPCPACFDSEHWRNCETCDGGGQLVGWAALSLLQKLRMRVPKQAARYLEVLGPRNPLAQVLSFCLEANYEKEAQPDDHQRG